MGRLIRVHSERTYLRGDEREDEEMPFTGGSGEMLHPDPRRIVNLTQHEATEEQRTEGVFEPEVEFKSELKGLLTFEELPSKEEIQRRAQRIARIAELELGYDDLRIHKREAMIGGAPYLMSALEKALKKKGIIPIYAFSKRVSEEKEVDGKVIKTQVFKHLGLVEVE